MPLPALLLAISSLMADPPDPRLAAAAARIEPAQLHAFVEKLVSFGTRHTLSQSTLADSKTRGIAASRRWLLAQGDELAQLPGSRLKPFVDSFEQPVAPRVPAAVQITNLGVVLPGVDAARAREAIVVTGHYDSRASDPLDATSDAPGAVDDAGGTAIAFALARALAAESPAVSVYFIAVAGEEQGLLGSRHLAERLQREGTRVLAMVSVDIAGNTDGQDGVHDAARARLFSEGVPAQETAAARKLREAIGGEADGAARQLARYLQREAAHSGELELVSMLRRDRIARGSDHLSFAQLGVPAVRLTDAREHWDRQHQNVRVQEGRAHGDDLAHFDATYAAKEARALLAGVGALAFAPAAPREVALGGALSTTAKLRWTLPGDPRIAGVVVLRRRADGLEWQRADRFGRVEQVELSGVVADDEFFAVATVDAQGHWSLPVAPGALQ